MSISSMPAPAIPAWRDREVDPSELEFQQLKVRLHAQLVESLDLSQMHRFDDARLRLEARRLAEQICQAQGGMLNRADLQRMIGDLVDEMFGLGPLERLMRDHEVADILVNHAHEVFVERRGRLELTDVIFADNDHLLRIIQRIVARLGRRIDEVSPLVDARLPDGSRVNAVVPPLAVHGPTLSIRRFGQHPLGMRQLIDNGSIPDEVVCFLAAAIQARLTCLISGGTGAGKTTLLNALSEFIPGNERLVTIEDSAELILRHKHVVSLETRPSNAEGTGLISQRDLVRNALRMRPDRIVVGEVRGPEVWDMLQAMNTGHEGSLTTVHANDTQDALARLEMMVAMTGFELPHRVVRQYIASSIRLIVQVSRLQGGARRLTRVSELCRLDGDHYTVQDIFGFDQDGVDEQGHATGTFYATGYQPESLARLEACGLELPDSIFLPRRWAPEFKVAAEAAGSDWPPLSDALSTNQ
jgi:pilus assembly protein CpaF